MKKNLLRLGLGKKYFSLISVDDKVKYITTISIFVIVMFPLTLFGLNILKENLTRAILDFSISAFCFLAIFFVRSTKIKINKIPIIPLTLFGIFCGYLLFTGERGGWSAAWCLAFPILSIFLSGWLYGTISSIILGIWMWVLLLSPWQLGFFNIGGAFFSAQYRIQDPVLSSRMFFIYLLIFAITLIYEQIKNYKTRQEIILTNNLKREKDTIQTMKDNMRMGIFLLDSDGKIEDQYSKQLENILSRKENLAGKNFIDLLSESLTIEQQQTMRDYFNMVLQKTHKLKMLEQVNPISEFEYIIDDTKKVLTSKFILIDDSEKPLILSILQDITKEKELMTKVQNKSLEQEREIKNLFSVLQIDPTIFSDFIVMIDTKFNEMNDTLKSQSFNIKNIITVFFQNIHAIKSEALILGLSDFGQKLHSFEDEIKELSNKKDISFEDTLHLTILLDNLMKEKEKYEDIIKKISNFRLANSLDKIIIDTFKKTADKAAEEKGLIGVNVKTKLDSELLKNDKIRVLIKDTSIQLIKNAVIHGIEMPDKRLEANKETIGTINISLQKNNDNKVELTVSDDGSGIDYEKIRKKTNLQNATIKELLPFIFKPEFSTANEVSLQAGRGVGLSYVRKIISENNGKISVGSSSKGTTFKITLS